MDQDMANDPFLRNIISVHRSRMTLAVSEEGEDSICLLMDRRLNPQMGTLQEEFCAGILSSSVGSKGKETG